MKHSYLLHAPLSLTVMVSILAAPAHAAPWAKNKDSVYEIQIFDSHPSHEEQIYPDGQCAAVYGETPPRVNACRAAGEWQSFDIVFTAPVFRDGQVVKLPTVTMHHNGILVHPATPGHGPCAHRNVLPCKPHADRMPLVLQGHGSPVEFRNIWIRPLEKSK